MYNDLINKGSNFADFVRFRPHTYVRIQQYLPHLLAATKTKIIWIYNWWNEHFICPMITAKIFQTSNSFDNIFEIVILVRYIITCTLNDDSVRCRDNVMVVLFYSYSCNLQQKFVEKFTKLRKIGFSVDCFTHSFLQFLTKKTSKFGFWVTCWVLAIKPKYFRDFLEIS